MASDWSTDTFRAAFRDELGVPACARAAFDEYYAATLERLGRSAGDGEARRALARWRPALERARAEADVVAFLAGGAGAAAFDEALRSLSLSLSLSRG